MSDSEGDKPQRPPEMDAEAMLQHMAADVAQQIQGLLGAFAPTFPARELPRLVEVIVREQLEISQQILPSLHDEDAVAQAPRFGVRIYGPLGSQDKPDPAKALRLIVDKTIGDDPGAALQTALILALLLQPGVRSLLRVNGYHYDFVQVKGAQPDTPRIIV